MTDSVKQAARWLATTPEAAKPHPEQFGLFSDAGYRGD